MSVFPSDFEPGARRGEMVDVPKAVAIVLPVLLGLLGCPLFGPLVLVLIFDEDIAADSVGFVSGFENSGDSLIALLGEGVSSGFPPGILVVFWYNGEDDLAISDDPPGEMAREVLPLMTGIPGV